MKVNLHVSFKDIYGEDTKKDGKVQMMDDLICQALYGGASVRPSKDPEDETKQKLDAFKLCMKIAQAEGEVELTSEEATLVKLAASGFNPGGYGQVYQLIEGGE